MASATHNGTCQVCGRHHASKPSGLAKHGYTVAMGFFSGTCSGSGEPPVEVSTSLLDRTVEQLEARAAKIEAATHALQCGPVALEYYDREAARSFRRGASGYRVKWLDSEDAFIRYGIEEPDRVKGHSWGMLCTVALRKQKTLAKGMRMHVATLRDLKRTRSGQPLYPREAIAPIPEGFCTGQRKEPKSRHRRYGECPDCGEMFATNRNGMVRHKKPVKK